MRHSASAEFWQLFNRLPKDVQGLARANFDLLRNDHRHPSLHFKRAGLYRSVRVGLSHRALGLEVDGDVLWVWIGTHGEYDRLLR